MIKASVIFRRRYIRDLNSFFFFLHFSSLSYSFYIPVIGWRRKKRSLRRTTSTLALSLWIQCEFVNWILSWQQKWQDDATVGFVFNINAFRIIQKDFELILSLSFRVFKIGPIILFIALHKNEIIFYSLQSGKMLKNMVIEKKKMKKNRRY